jgi:NTP pyrophosphatase (non-canonical NTP hydrolase)
MDQMSKPTPPSRIEPFVILPPEVEEAGSVGMNAYQRVTKTTDRMERSGLDVPILGLFGEVGSLLSALKKKQRDQAAFTKYDTAILEELGDVLWYFSNIASRAGLDLSVLAQRMFREVGDWDEVESHEAGTFGDIQAQQERAASPGEFGARLIDLAGRVGDLVNDFGSGRIKANRDVLSAHLVDIFRTLVAAADAAHVSLDDAAYRNLQKIFSRWPIEPRYPEPFDVGMPNNERLMRKFTMVFDELEVNGKLYVIQKCNGIIIGDRLTDNKTEKDDYRFHDVFHIAYAVHMEWSLVLRALFKLKRKSKPEVDENQDGARAILIEEGVSTFIFGRGIDRGRFEGLQHVDYDLLKSIQEFVRGYEVERCALWQWEKAILDGFRVFRELTKHRRGRVIADLDAHTLEFREGTDEN